MRALVSFVVFAAEAQDEVRDGLTKQLRTLPGSRP